MFLFRDEETEKGSSSPSSLAPKPPSRNSSFRAARLSSSSAVFGETPEKKPTSPIGSCFTHGGSQHETVYSPTRKSSSAEDLDKPQPPKRYSRSTLLNSFRGNKKAGYVPRTTASSALLDEDLVLHHTRTKSLPTSKVVATHLSSKSCVIDDASADARNEERLPRSSSFSRARVIQTSSVQTVRSECKPSSRGNDAFEETVQTSPSDESKAALYSTVSEVNYKRSNRQTGIIQALKTGEITTSEIDESQVLAKPGEQLRNSYKWSEQEYKGITGEAEHYTETKPKMFKHKLEERPLSETHKPKIEVQPKSILKREAPKPESKKEKPIPAPILKENSLMQRLLQESQGLGGSSERSTAAAIEKEINQRTGRISVKSTKNSKTVDEDQRLVRTLFILHHTLFAWYAIFSSSA